MFTAVFLSRSSRSLILLFFFFKNSYLETVLSSQMPSVSVLEGHSLEILKAARVPCSLQEGLPRDVSAGWVWISARCQEWWPQSCGSSLGPPNAKRQVLTVQGGKTVIPLKCFCSWQQGRSAECHSTDAFSANSPVVHRPQSVTQVGHDCCRRPNPGIVPSPLWQIS